MNALQRIQSDHLPTRMRAAISLAWSLFARKVGGELIKINKEASMQLQFGYMLQQVLPLITFHKSEKVDLELETTVEAREIDVFLTGTSESTDHKSPSN